MRNILHKIIFAALLLPCLISCRYFSGILHDSPAVARAGRNTLYLDELEAVIPDGISEEDSLRLAIQYINNWASDLLFMELAESQLSKQEKDVTRELESYRRSLLKYRYEQYYINERLDTAVTSAEIESYYTGHASDFISKRPVVKARFMRISSDSPNINVIKKKMASDDEADIIEADSLTYSSAEFFKQYGGNWIDVVTLASDMGIDYGDLMKVRPGLFIENVPREGMTDFVYIVDVVPSGSIPPVEYCREKIVDIILSTRKHRLTLDLERELIEDAREKGKFEIY
ncbi:MAG: hypothetical protein ACI3ZN_07380 [Candidatus Cryptobacteroides sp.]